MENKSCMESILTDITFMECIGMLPVIVHGGGKAISRSMKEHGIEPVFLNGHRVTREKSIKVVKKVLKDKVNPDIVAILSQKGAKVEGLPGENIFKVRKKT